MSSVSEICVFLLCEDAANTGMYTSLVVGSVRWVEGTVGIHRRQPQLVLVASLGLVLIIIGMLWVILLPDPSGAVIIK